MERFRNTDCSSSRGTTWSQSINNSTAATPRGPWAHNLLHSAEATPGGRPRHTIYQGVNVNRRPLEEKILKRGQE
jgi:hypothetical protein